MVDPKNNQSEEETVVFNKEWKPLRNSIHTGLSSLISLSKGLRNEIEYLKNDVAIPFYNQSVEKSYNFLKISENLTREYPIILISATGLLFASFGKRYRLKKFIFGSIICTAVCYPNHAVKLFTAPYEYIKELDNIKKEDI